MMGDVFFVANMAPIWWLLLFIVLLVIEIFTLGLTTIWFAGGAIVACICAWLGAGIGIQIGAFLIVSILLLAITRPYAMKHFNQARTKTNAEALIGEEALVVEKIDDLRGTGKVKVRGIEWSARTEEKEQDVEPGEAVIIVAIQGVKLLVKKKED